MLLYGSIPQLDLLQYAIILGLAKHTHVQDAHGK